MGRCKVESHYMRNVKAYQNVYRLRWPLEQRISLICVNIASWLPPTILSNRTWTVKHNISHLQNNCEIGFQLIVDYVNFNMIGRFKMDYLSENAFGIIFKQLMLNITYNWPLNWHPMRCMTLATVSKFSQPIKDVPCTQCQFIRNSKRHT